MDRRFVPAFCPLPDCVSFSGEDFRFTRKGSFRRACDGMAVARFRCQSCERTFSRQTFRLSYRMRRPALRIQLFHLLTAKVTQRQAARILGCSRDTVDRLSRRLGRVARDFHRARMRPWRGRLEGTFQLDELETFETHRLTRPVTVPVLIERRSYFILRTRTAPMGPRGRLSEENRKRVDLDRERFGVRVNGSLGAVDACLRTLEEMLAPGALLHLQTDRKSSYRSLTRKRFSGRLGSHVRESSRRRRDYGNVLFPINHTLAMLRDGVSRLVRRSWGASKCRRRLQGHLDLWTAYRNYVRGVTARSPNVTPAMAIGVCRSPYRVREIVSWRWPQLMVRGTAKQARFR